MPATIEKTYADALFCLITEEWGSKSEKLTETLTELKAINSVFEQTPELIKLMNVPTVSRTEKLTILEKAFKGKVTPYTYNFLCVLTDKNRIRCFKSIYRCYTTMYNETFGITEITITTAMPLDDVLREKVKNRMEKLTGKKVNLSEKIDKSLISGIIIDYDGIKLDGSVKAKLAALKKDIMEVIA